MHRRAMGRMRTGCAAVAVAMAAASVCCDVTEAADKLQWKSFTITFQAEHGEKPESKGGELKLSLRIPADMKQGEALRGFMPQLKGLDALAHRNRIAMCKGLMGPYGGPNQAMRDAAAKATGHAELKHAGAILQGLSYAGRVRAHYAAHNPGHTLAVILDHSWAPSSMSIKPGKYSYGSLPAAQGVPLFFNASRNDSFQNMDRRALHYNWCTTAFRRYMQACTTVIHHERGGHGSVGSRDLLAAWLEEVLALRLPKSIPTDGTPYKLTPINPHKVGGLVVASLAKDAEGLTVHTDVAIAPVSLVRNRAKCNWWVPGGKSAAIYVDWVKRNGGKVARDMTAKFPNAPETDATSSSNARTEAPAVRRKPPANGYCPVIPPPRHVSILSICRDLPRGEPRRAKFFSEILSRNTQTEGF